MADEEPTDEVRAVAMTAGAAAARVVETIMREAANRRRDQQHEADRQGDRAQREAIAGEVAAARSWARNADPDRFAAFTADKTPGASEGLVTAWRTAGAPDALAAAVKADRSRQELEQAKAWATPERRREFEHEHMGSDSSDGRQQADRRLLNEWREATGQTQPKGKALADLSPEQRAAAEKLQQGIRDRMAFDEEYRAKHPRPVDPELKPAKRAATEQVQADLGQQPALPYDSAERRAAADVAMREAGVPDEARQARNISDTMNGRDPAEAASAGAAPKVQTRGAARPQERQRGR